MQPVEGDAIALKNRGHKVTKLSRKRTHRMNKGKLNKHVKFQRDIVREVVGMAPYEKRALELLRIGKDKKAGKFLKRRIGSLRRAKRKRDEVQSILTAQRKHAGKH